MEKSLAITIIVFVIVTSLLIIGCTSSSPQSSIDYVAFKVNSMTTSNQLGSYPLQSIH